MKVNDIYLKCCADFKIFKLETNELLYEGRDIDIPPGLLDLDVSYFVPSSFDEITIYVI